MNVGDSVFVHLWSNGEAYAAEPHFRNRVAFQSDFMVSDLPMNSPGRTQVAMALSGVLPQDLLASQPLELAQLLPQMHAVQHEANPPEVGLTCSNHGTAVVAPMAVLLGEMPPRSLDPFAGLHGSVSSPDLLLP